MSQNKNLHTAKYEEIENELQLYTEEFKGKIIYCNYDDYE